MNERNILFIMPDERKVYRDGHFRIGDLHHLPSLAFAILGTIAKSNGFNPKVLDLTLYDRDEKILQEKVFKLNPIFVGITCTSATYFHAVQIAKFVKKESPNTKILIGGPHVSSTVAETLTNYDFDYLFIGETEESFDRFLKGINRYHIEGLAFRGDNGNIHIFPNSSFLTNLDNLPYPDYNIYDLSKYRLSKLHSKRNPVVWIETSRGCPFNCKICNKVVHGQNFRPKSPGRVLDEIEYLIKHGVKHLFIADEGFTTQMERAEKICDSILERDLDITWDCFAGIRVDRVNYRLLKKMRKSGCQRIAFGIESGNQSVLNSIGKGITLEQITTAVKMAKKAGIEVFGFFMLGFIDDTEETMQDTIEFAKKLPLDIAKVSSVVPFPGSPLYAQYCALNLIYPPGDYRNYNIHTSPKYIYRHPTLDGDVIRKYHSKFYKNFYFNPKYIIRRLLSSIRNQTLFSDIKTALVSSELMFTKN